jgi:hypothetical protein
LPSQDVHFQSEPKPQLWYLLCWSWACRIWSNTIQVCSSNRDLKLVLFFCWCRRSLSSWSTGSCRNNWDRDARAEIVVHRVAEIVAHTSSTVGFVCFSRRSNVNLVWREFTVLALQYSTVLMSERTSSTLLGSFVYST